MAHQLIYRQSDFFQFPAPMNFRIALEVRRNRFGADFLELCKFRQGNIVQLEPAEVVRKDQYKNTLVKKGTTIGANATIVCGVTLGEYSFIAAGAVVTKDVKPFALMAGVPAKQIGWMSKYGERVELPVSGSGHWKCPHLSDLYTLENGSLIST